MNPILIAIGFGVLAWLVTKLNLSPHVQVTTHNPQASGAPNGSGSTFNNAAPLLPPNQAQQNAYYNPGNPNSNRADVPDNPSALKPAYLTSNVPADRDLDKATKFMGLRDPNEGKAPVKKPGCGCGEKKGCGGCNSTAPASSTGAGGCMSSSTRSLLRSIAKCNPRAFQAFDDNLPDGGPTWGEGDHFTVNILPTGRAALGAVAQAIENIGSVFGNPNQYTVDPNTLDGGGRSTQEQLSDYFAKQTQQLLAYESYYFNPPQNAQPITIWNANK